MEQSRWYLILNPMSGGGKAAKSKAEILRELEAQSIAYECYETRSIEDATRATKLAIENGFRNFLVAGGDGTLNEVVNGMMQQTAVPISTLLLAQIPVGTGNDWRRTWKIPGSVKASITCLKHPKIAFQDVAKIDYYLEGKSKSSYFLNVAGCGFDAEVAIAANKAKAQGKSGFFTYISQLIITLSRYKEPVVRFKMDDSEQEAMLFALLAGICKYAGNAMKLVPEAQPDDGLFHLTIARKISRLKVIGNLGRLFSGSFVELKEVSSSTCKRLEVFTEGLSIQADGESIGQTPAIFEILPYQLQVVSA